VPTAVEDFEQFDGSNPFDLIKLCGALLDQSNYDSTKHGILSAVIHYHTPCSAIDGRKVLPFFALEVDMSINTIYRHPIYS